MILISEVPKVFNDESGETIDAKLKSRADARKTEKEHVLVEKVNEFLKSK